MKVEADKSVREALESAIEQIKPEEEKPSRSELRKLADKVVGAFQTHQERRFNWAEALPTIEAEGEKFILVLETSADAAVARADMRLGADAKTYWDLFRGIDRPFVVEVEVTPRSLKRMGPNARSELRHLMEGLRDLAAGNKYFIGRVRATPEAEKYLKLDHNKKDEVRSESMGGVVTVYNTSLEGYASYIVGPAAITITDASGVKSTVLYSDKDAAGKGLQYNGTTAQNVVAGAVVLFAESISERTFHGLMQVDAEHYRFQNQDAVNAMGLFVQIVTAAYRSELRTKTAA